MRTETGKNWDAASIAMATALVVALAVLYFPFITKLVIDWGDNEDYSHGYFIPFMSLYFVYSKRKALSEIEVKPNSFGLLLVILGLVQLVLGKVGSEYFIQRTSMIPLLMGLVLFLFGWQYLKQLLVPILFLFFMIPLPAIIWNKIAFPMQLFASMITENVIYFLGIPVFREGNILHLSETTLEVVAACSGLRSLMTMFALGAALAFLSDFPQSKRWMLFFSAAPIAVLANVIRLTITAMLASRYGAGVADGFLHDFSGLVVFVLGLAMLLGLYLMMVKKAVPSAEKS